MKAEIFNLLLPAIVAVLQGERWFVEPMDPMKLGPRALLVSARGDRIPPHEDYRG
jgi:hypothetical protein